MKAEDIFLAALDKQTLPERKVFLDTACGDDCALRVQVEGLLRSHQEAGSFLDAPLFDLFTPTIDHSARPSHGQATPSDEIPLDFLAPSTDPEALGRIGPYDVTEAI